MPAKTDKPLRFRVWLLLSATLLALGAVAVLSVSRLALQRYQTDFRSNLLAVGHLLAGSAASGSTAVLRDARADVPGLQAIFELTPSDNGFDIEQFGVKDDALKLTTSNLATAKEVLELGNSTVEQEGPNGVYQGYVPVLGADHQPAKVLVVVKSSGELLARSAAVSSGILWTLLVIVLLSLVFAQILASYLTTLLASDAPVAAGLTLSRFIKGTVLELSLAILSAVVIATAAFGFLVGRDLDAGAAKALQQVTRIEDLRTRLVVSLADGAAGESATSELRGLAVQAGVPWPYETNSLTRDQLSELARAAGDELKRETSSYDSLQEAVTFRNESLLAVFGIASFLSLGAIVLLRTARRQERELLSAREDMARQEAEYKHIADNLPIGFYTYTPGVIETSNPAWDRLVGREAEEDRWQIFASRIHPEDRQRVIDTFEKAARDLNPFGIAYRLQMPEGSMRHVETRAVAVRDEEGDLQHIVGFLVDISSRVRAQRLLEDKNREVSSSNDMLRKALTEIEDNFEAMVHSLVKAVEAKDPYTAGHSERVMAYSLKIGERLGLSQDEMRVLKMGTLIHDIGKIGIPDAILTKPSHLTDEEYEMIKQHPMLGYQMIESIPTFAECLPIVLHHHERLDGKGYPYALKGLEIPLLVRICTVSDCFDAMTSDRAYRKGLDPQIAIEELFMSSDRKIVDRHLVEVLAEIISEEGLTVVPSASVA